MTEQPDLETVEKPTAKKSATNENKSPPELRNAEVNDSCHVCGKLLDCLFQCLLIESALPLELSIPPQRCLLRRPLIR